MKGETKGYLTFILHLAPADLSGYEVCQYRSKGCTALCLNTAGRGGIFKTGETSNVIQRARIARTKFFFEDQKAFMLQLEKEISKAIRYAWDRELEPVFRLNGTSDIKWESIRCGNFANVFTRFAGIQFYDYTKAPLTDRMGAFTCINYHLTFSLSETIASKFHASRYIENGLNAAVVFAGPLAEKFMGLQVVNGDESDLRFLDPKRVIVGLKAKGRARKSDSNFVVKG
jgi:hypothetical protein